MGLDAIGIDGQTSAFSLGQGVRYYGRRVRFFERVERTCRVALLLFVVGSAVHIYRVGLGPGVLGLFMGVSITVFVFAIGLDRKAQQHRRLLDRLIQLDRWATGIDMTRDNARHLTRDVEQILADEPPRLRILNALCHQAQCQAMGMVQDESFNVSRLQRICAPVLDWRAQTLTLPPSETEPPSRESISGRRR